MMAISESDYLIPVETFAHIAEYGETAAAMIEIIKLNYTLFRDVIARYRMKLPKGCVTMAIRCSAGAHGTLTLPKKSDESLSSALESAKTHLMREIKQLSRHLDGSPEHMCVIKTMLSAKFAAEAKEYALTSDNVKLTATPSVATFFEADKQLTELVQQLTYVYIAINERNAALKSAADARSCDDIDVNATIAAIKERFPDARHPFHDFYRRGGIVIMGAADLVDLIKSAAIKIVWSDGDANGDTGLPICQRIETALYRIMYSMNRAIVYRVSEKKLRCRELSGMEQTERHINNVADKLSATLDDLRTGKAPIAPFIEYATLRDILYE